MAAAFLAASYGAAAPFNHSGWSGRNKAWNWNLHRGFKSSRNFKWWCQCVSSKSNYGYGGKPAEEVSVMVTGSTGYIGRFVVKELLNRGYKVVAVARQGSNANPSVEEEKSSSGSLECVTGDVTNKESLEKSLTSQGIGKIDVVVCCLASRSGGVADSWNIDYQASRNSFDVGLELGASHLVLLSAICVQKPLLHFQRAKLKLEAEIQGLPSNPTWSIVRPTAFFKSLAGQVDIVKAGGPFVVFGDGRLCSCKPISESDLASFICDCISDESKHQKLLPIGGPGRAYTPLEQGDLLFEITGKSRRFVKVPIQIMDFAIGLLDSVAGFFPDNAGIQDAAEYAKIGRYYAAESMLVLDPDTGCYDADATPSYGTDTLEAFFQRVVMEGMAGQELGEQVPSFLRSDS
ncbi:divinyl chlorophyllide a 8-vinyl-reductase, chloroplastic [Selaginella moellendorffii]|nr:divinyl chlorophyllide a 8-vinyl-reductase, chloroplastic [Selaginella moellendorffii]|eukprot:XP_002987313.2 divinyl chlorophyllide a 8-vinyl-reductase, chloroplastic [Selaginella moellendorffii]